MRALEWGILWAGAACILLGMVVLAIVDAILKAVSRRKAT
jgi:hypothetical protein